MTEFMNVAEARRTAELLLTKLKELDGAAVPPREAGRSRSAALAELTKSMLYAAHLARLTETHVLSEYHSIKGFKEHL